MAWCSVALALFEMFCKIKNDMLYFPRFHTVFHSYCNKKLICISFIWFDSIKYYQHSGNQPESKKISTEKKLQFINYHLSSEAFTLFYSMILFDSPGVTIIFYNKETGKKQVQSSSDTVNVHTKKIAAERNIDIPELYSMLRGIYPIS